jgi:hypothetical protein
LVEDNNMKKPATKKAAPADRATQEVRFLTLPTTWFSHCVNPTPWLSNSQGQIATSADRSTELQATALERWENEGGRINKPGGAW